MAIAAMLPAAPIRGLVRSMERIAEPSALRRVEEEILKSIPHLRPHQMLEFLEAYSKAPKISSQILSATWDPLKHLAWYWDARQSAAALRTLSLMGRDASLGVQPILDRMFGDLRTDLSMLPNQEALSVVTSLAKLDLCTYERLGIMLEESGLDLARALDPTDLCSLLLIFDQLVEIAPESKTFVEQATHIMQTAFRLESSLKPDEVLPLLSTSLTLRNLQRSDGWHRFLLQKLRSNLTLTKAEDLRALIHVALLSPKSKDLCQMIPPLANSITQMLPQLSLDDLADFYRLSQKLDYRDDYSMDRIRYAVRSRVADQRHGRLELLRSVEKSRTLIRALKDPAAF